MRWDVKVTVYFSFSAAFLAVFAMVAPDVLHLTEATKIITFFGGLGGAVLFGAAGFRAAIIGEKAAPQKGHKRRMIGLYGMIVCSIGLLSFATLYFWPEQKAKIASHSTNADAKSSPLGVSSTSQINADTSLLVVTIQAHNFARSLREFRSDFIVNNKKWNDIEWDNFSHADKRVDEDRIWELNITRARSRQQEFTSRFHQSYKKYAIELSDRLNKELRDIGIVPLTPGFATPLPPGFDTFKVTVESPAVKSTVTEGLIARMADYFDGLANQFPHEVGDEPSKVP